MGSFVTIRLRNLNHNVGLRPWQGLLYMTSILELTLQLVMLLVLVIPPGFLWGRILLPSSSLIEHIALAPGLSFVFMVPCAFLLWGPAKLAVDVSGTAVVYLVCVVPAMSWLLFNNRKEVLTKIRKWLAVSFWKGMIQRAPRTVKKAHVVLLLVICFAAVLNYQPHFDYPFPLHTDEWHYVIRGQSLVNVQDFSEQTGSYAETGYLALLIVIIQFTGISWFDLVLLLPTLVLSYAIILFFLVGRKHGLGHLVIFLLLLIPTSVRYLGPVFMVPVALFLVTLPLALLILNRSKPRSLALLPLLVISQVLVHPPSALALFFVILASAVMMIKANSKRAIGIFAILGCLAALSVLPLDLWVSDLKWSEVTEHGSFFLAPPSFTGYITTIGILLLFLSLLGAVNILKEKSRLGITVLIITSALILLVGIFVYVFPRFNNVTALHDRTVFCLMVVLVIPGGFGIKGLAKLDFRLAFCTIAVLLVVSSGLHFEAEYYHIIDEGEYEDFLWIKENLNDSCEKAVLHPWKAIAFRAVTGKEVYYSVPQGPSSVYESRMREVEDFFADECQDTSFLTRHGITIVYTKGACTNPDLQQVHPRIYVLLS
ncbi:MAG: hypothetical protein JSW28_10045 [Thermoplasmata archaeon]|nr:MAG: hypothetical protein JSW28_10045 [Thermoplasmata archaeon]